MTDADVVLDAERLRLEPVRREHAAELFDALSDRTGYLYVPVDPPPDVATLAERYAFLERRSSPDGAERWLNWVLRLRDGGRCIGTVQATVRADGTAALAYELGPAHWGHGYANEGCRRTLDALFDDYGVHEVVALVDTRNAPSIRLLERLGFRRGELRRGADRFKGATSDEYTYHLPIADRAVRDERV